ncbi:acetyl-CoA carboxylase biotin carboxyl carrier protein [Siminovitchia sp. 179-K 8D1 HS]|uniref:acetyl-CoA carboxylase biotin carboxyl carrier protein n=1 Tax=Siminovitchia sp. 179-K 8D1 HS TaxID=3142385 RepID=UPI00399F0958
MLKVQEIREIIKLVDQSDIDVFVYEHDGSKIKLKKKGYKIAQEVHPQAAVQPQTEQPVVSEGPAVQPAPVQTQAESAAVQPTPAPETADESNLHKITSPMVGTFYQAPSPDSEPYVKVGSRVSENTIVCIVEAMKLFNEIEAEVEGEIVQILVKDGELVEYGQPLFLVKPR